MRTQYCHKQCTLCNSNLQGIVFSVLCFMLKNLLEILNKPLNVMYLKKMKRVLNVYILCIANITTEPRAKSHEKFSPARNNMKITLLTWPFSKVQFLTHACTIEEPRSSVSIVSNYGLDGRGSIPDRGSGAHPASYTTGTGGSFPGVKRGRSVILTTHPLLVPRLRVGAVPPLLPKRVHGV
jgi:hypothetical protein